MSPVKIFSGLCNFHTIYCSFIFKFVKVLNTKCMINLMRRKLVDSKLGIRTGL